MRRFAPGAYRLAIACNTPFVLFALANLIGAPDVFKSFFVNLVCFIAPGLAWLGLTADGVRERALKVFFIVGLSLVVWMTVILAHIALEAPRTAFSFAVAGFAATNVGVLLQARHDAANAFLDDLVESGAHRIYAGLLIGVYGVTYLFAAVLPPTYDHDFKSPGGAPGMVEAFKPYFAYNVAEQTFYFPHPPLMSVNVGLAAALGDELKRIDFYVPSGRAASVLMKSAPGFKTRTTYSPIAPGVAATTIIGENIDGETFRMTVQNADDSFLDVEAYTAEYRYNAAFPLVLSAPGVRVYEAERIFVPEFYFAQDRRVFMARDGQIAMRLGILLLPALAAVMLYQIGVDLTGRKWLGGVAAALCVFTPGMLVRTAMAGHIGTTLVALIGLAYFLWLRRDERWFDWLRRPYLLIPGFYAGFADQKTLVVFAGFGLFLLWRWARDDRTVKGLGHAVASGFLHSATIGFVLGNLLFALVGFISDWENWFYFYIWLHFVDRFVSGPTTLINPNFLGLWEDTLKEAPVYVLAAGLGVWAAAQRKWKDLFGDHIFFFLVIAITALGFSKVDWKMSKHLMTAIPFLALVSVLMISWMGEGRARQAALVACGAVIAIGAGFGGLLLIDFGAYTPKPFW